MTHKTHPDPRGSTKLLGTRKAIRVIRPPAADSTGAPPSTGSGSRCPAPEDTSTRIAEPCPAFAGQGSLVHGPSAAGDHDVETVMVVG